MLLRGHLNVGSWLHLAVRVGLLPSPFIPNFRTFRAVRSVMWSKANVCGKFILALTEFRHYHLSNSAPSARSARILSSAAGPFLRLHLSRLIEIAVRGALPFLLRDPPVPSTKRCRECFLWCLPQGDRVLPRYMVSSPLASRRSPREADPHRWVRKVPASAISSSPNTSSAIGPPRAVGPQSISCE